MRAPTLILALSSALIACNGKGTVKLNEDPLVDTDEPVDTDLVDDTGLRDTGATPLLVAGSFSVDNDRSRTPSGKIAIGMVWLDTQQDAFVLGDTLASDSVRAPSPGAAVDYAIALPDAVPNRFLQPTGEADAPNERIAMFMVGAWVDDNGDGLYDVGEPVVGGRMDLILYLEQGPSAAAASLGADEGWNRTTFDPLAVDTLSAITPIANGVDDHDLSANLIPRDRGALTLTIAPALGVTVNIDLLNLGADIAASPSDPTLATVSSVNATNAGAQGVFNAIPDPPPEDHFSAEVGDGIRYTMEVGLAYRDMNGNGRYDESSDWPMAASMGGAEPRLLFYIEPTDLVATLWTAMGLDAGWNLLLADDNAALPSSFEWSQGMVLVGF